MENTIETIKFVAELAHDRGVIEAQNTQLQQEIALLKEENQKLKEMMAAIQPTVVVQQVIVLSPRKIVAYVKALDNNDRRTVGHFMLHTLVDGTSTNVKEQVSEMTSLEGNQTRQLNVNGDLVMEKHVENEVGNVESGATGIKTEDGKNG